MGRCGHYPAHGRPPARNGLAITSLVLGIAALITSWLALPGIILGLLAVIFGGVGIARGRSDRVSNKGMAIGGLITGGLGLAIGVGLLIVGFQIAHRPPTFRTCESGAAGPAVPSRVALVGVPLVGRLQRQQHDGGKGEQQADRVERNDGTDR